MANKCNREEFQVRINRLVELITECRSECSIRRELAAEWGVSDRQMQRYMAKAHQSIVQLWDIKRETFVARSLEKLETIINKAITSNQLSAAVGAVACQLRVVGCDAPKR
jgi:predicted DNA-binding transcriptional regulator YafY